MKILVITQYFWPENFRINDLVGELTQRGHEVTVLTGLPNYPDGKIFANYTSEPGAFSSYANAQLVRTPLFPRGKGGIRLFLNYLSFAISASLLGPLKLRGKAFDAIFVFEPSPITIGLPAIVLKYLKRAPIAFWVLDLWPQSLEAVGAVRSPRILRLVDHLVRFIYSHCDRILAQSKSFVTAIAKQAPDPDRIVYFPSWAEPAVPMDTVEPAPELPVRSDLFTIVFTGNVGEAQDFGAVLSAAELLREEPFRWVIVGDGRSFSWLQAQIASRGLEKSVLALGRFPLERMPSFFRHADALLVSLRDEPIFALTIPGKVQSYLAAGVPILAMLNGEGARVVEASGAGIAVPAGASRELATAALKLGAMDNSERQKMGINGIDCIAREFDRDKLISRLEKLLTEMAETNTRKV